MTCYGDCVPAVNSRTGEILTGSCGRTKARWFLEQREGPPPFPGAHCRHLCDNDSMARNGFVCTLHTTWGTRSENMMDRSPENRVKGPRIGGRKNVESGQLSSIQSKGSNSPRHPNKVKVTCPYCGKVGNKLPMARWHFDNCKFKPEVS